MASNLEGFYRQHKIHPAVTLVAAVLFLLVASILFESAASRFSSARASRSWPGVEGLIIESRLPTPCTHCRPILNYRYVVNGQSLVGEHIVAGPQDYYNSEDAEAKLRENVVGRKITVYYDPANAAKSCLEPGVFRWPVYLFSSIGLCCLGASCFLLWRVYRGRPNSLARSSEPAPSIETYDFSPKD
jgi:hypothetical protein